MIQKDFSLTETPFLDLALKLDISEELLLEKINFYLEVGILTRVGPFFNMDKSSGYVTLVAMDIPISRFDEVSEIVNNYVEVAHNYKREHQFNMWFVLATQDKASALDILLEIESRTQIKTFNFPKLHEFALDLFLEVK